MRQTIERTFDLINSEGAAYPLSRYNTFSGFFGEVEGLGMDHDSVYQKLGNVYDLLQDNINQGEISGVVYFQSKYPYQEYARFVEFCQSTPLKLRHVNPVGEFFRDGVVSRIEKNEDGSPKRAKITFTTSSLWYRPMAVVNGVHGVRMVSDSVNESPCILTFSGINQPTSNILWNQWVDNVLIMTGGLIGVTVAATDKIVVRTDTNPYEIYKLSGSTKTNLYQYSDFSKARFPFIRKGLNEFTAVDFNSVSVEGNILYESI